jgi:bacteriocin-like protein
MVSLLGQNCPQRTVAGKYFSFAVRQRILPAAWSTQPSHQRRTIMQELNVNEMQQVNGGLLMLIPLLIGLDAVLWTAIGVKAIT